MNAKQGYWAGMSPRLRVRAALGAVYLALAGFVISQAPILGIFILTLPILWTVIVIWSGSEDGAGFGPHSRSRETAFSYTVQHIWQTSRVSRVLLVGILLTATVGGLGWMSTEKMRAEIAEPTLTERATSAAKSATETTKETATGWFATAKGWFSGDDAAD